MNVAITSVAEQPSSSFGLCWSEPEHWPALPLQSSAREQGQLAIILIKRKGLTSGQWFRAHCGTASYTVSCVCVFSAFLPSAHLPSPASLAARASHLLVALTLGVSYFVSAAWLHKLCDVFRPALPIASSHPFFLVPASSSSTRLSVQVDSAVATCFHPRRFWLGLLYL